MPELRNSSSFKFLFATVAVGILAGCSGLLLVLCLHYLQHLAFGYSPHLIISPEHFLEGVSAAAPSRRIEVLLICGLIAGVGWWGIYRYGPPLVSIAKALKLDKPYMPVLSTMAHALLQIITIALGSPLGREVAPREVGAMCAIVLSNHLNLTGRETKILLACGAGAGLAAVYNVPLGGALFTMEVLLQQYNRQALLPAILTSIIAARIARLGLGDANQYEIVDMTLSYSLMVWSIFAGPIFGLMAYGFNKIAMRARESAPKDRRLLLFCLINFTILGLLSVYYPALLGNGKSPVQLSLTEPIAIKMAAILLILRVLVTWSSLRAGAQGGLLTPSLANGALLAVVLGGCWSVFWPGASQGAYAVIGATAFLAASQKMPVTAVALIFELTGMQLNLLLPIIIAIGGSLWMNRRLGRYSKLEFS